MRHESARRWRERSVRRPQPDRTTSSVCRMRGSQWEGQAEVLSIKTEVCSEQQEGGREGGRVAVIIKEEPRKDGRESGRERSGSSSVRGRNLCPGPGLRVSRDVGVLWVAPTKREVEAPPHLGTRLHHPPSRDGTRSTLAQRKRAKEGSEVFVGLEYIVRKGQLKWDGSCFTEGRRHGEREGMAALLTLGNRGNCSVFPARAQEDVSEHL